jgi:Spy/CpxP family protein refolding chaperone
MLGFIFGTLCLIGFIAVWRRRRGWGWYGCGWGPGGHVHGGRVHGGRFGWRRRFGLYRVFEELDTSPGQEKAIRAALDELRGVLATLRPQLEQARQSVAAALTSAPFDGEALERTLQGRIADASSCGPALAVALGKIHEALDADQRKRLARLVDALPHGPAF